MELSVELEPEMTSDASELDTCTTERDRPVDLVHLAKYTLGSRELEREVLSLFQSQSAVYVERLETADCEKSWHDAAHSLKGSAKAIGAWSVSQTAEKLENAGDEALAGGKADMLRPLKRELDEACAFIEKLD